MQRNDILNPFLLKQKYQNTNTILFKYRIKRSSFYKIIQKAKKTDQRYTIYKIIILIEKYIEAQNL